MALSLGTHLGAYEILSFLGRGGMGEVYKARDTRLNRPVAIKILLRTDPELKARFEREAKAIASLNHPHICTLYDVGTQGETDYLVMEFLEGEPLHRRIAQGPIPIDQAVKIATEIADALDKAHRARIVHRDLKPSNVMLTKGGVKLLDFGLAKVWAPIAETSEPTTVAWEDTLAIPGRVWGTPPYMAPEQFDGRDVDARTDIFAFGSVLYEMITAKRAFEGQSHASVIAAICDRTFVPSYDNLPTPPGLDRVVRKCLAKDPDDRWQTAKDLGDELRWLVTPSSGSVGIPPPNQNGEKVAKRRRFVFRLTIGISLSAVISIGLIRGASYRRSRSSAPKGQVVSDALPPIDFHASPKSLQVPRLSLSPEQVQTLVEQHLATARAQMAAHDNASALSDHLRPALELQPANSAARALKRQAEDALVSAVQAERPTIRTGPTPPPGKVGVPGITRRLNETPTDYDARVKRILVTFAEGKKSLEKGDFVTALRDFRAVEQDQIGYQHVDLLISESLRKQPFSFVEAFADGQRNEEDGKLRDARLWYQRALAIDPTQNDARDKVASLQTRMTSEANELLTRASAAEKVNEVGKAIQYYQKIVDMMLPGDEIRDRAAKRLEALKR